MNPEEELTGTVEEIAELAQALYALRDVLNNTSLYLKDIRATTDFAAQGQVRAQAEAALQNLLRLHGPHTG